MKKSKYACIGIISIIASIALIVLLITSKNSSSTNIIKICCNVETANTCFDIEIANNDELRSLGLMFRENLPDGSGMLFTYDKPSTYSFWMKNTLIPLAGIRLDPDLKIVDIILMDPCKTQECPSYKPKSEAQYVLEINQGLISEKGLLKIGNQCKLIKSELNLKKHQKNRSVLKSKF